MGQLIPIQVIEILPGDTLQGRTSATIRVSLLLKPVMHQVQVRIHHWFVPNRIIYDGWEDFITGGPDGNNSDTPPTYVQGAGAELLGDYLGVPPGVDGQIVSELPVRSYNKIFNEWYRDQDLVPELAENTRVVQKIAWERDYFTSARPTPQKGDEITLPVAGMAPIVGLGASDTATETNVTGEETDKGTQVYPFGRNVTGVGSANQLVMEAEENGNPQIYADLSQAEQITINDFRKGFALQRYQEARSRYGSRYTEYLRYLGIKSSDARLDRPEFLGGGRTNINFSEVLNTTGDPQGQEEAFVGDLHGHGIASMRTNRFRRFFEEHGIMLTLLSIRPKTMYSNSLHRKFSRTTKEDYWQKELQFIGQEPVLSKEVFSEAGAPGDVIFGWQDRYQTYKREPSIVTAEFRELINDWHMSREFSIAPVLNEDFISCDATKRIHAEQVQHSMWCMINNSVQARRMVSASSESRIL